MTLGPVGMLAERSHVVIRLNPSQRIKPDVKKQTNEKQPDMCWCFGVESLNIIGITMTLKKTASVQIQTHTQSVKTN